MVRRPSTPLGNAVAAVTLALSAPASAATPSVFSADGIATSPAQGGAVPVHVAYRSGHLRLDLAVPHGPQGTDGSAVFLAGKGEPYVYYLNPAGKVAFRIRQADADAQAELPVAQILDFTGWRRTLTARGHRVGAATVAGEACSQWRMPLAHATYDVWLSDRYDVPFRITTRTAHGAQDFRIRRFEPGTAPAATAFAVPHGYQVTDLGTSARTR